MSDTAQVPTSTAEPAAVMTAPPSSFTGDATSKTKEATKLEDTPKTAETAESSIEKPSGKSTEPVESKETPAAEATTTATTPFAQFASQLPHLLEEVGHDEMWGVTLSTVSPIESHIPTQIILQKFLNANEGDLTQAISQFKSSLQFRKEKKPLELLNQTFSAKKYSTLGLVTWYPGQDPAVPEVFTWNLYGNVKDRMDEVFIPLEDFLSYRIALQELGIKHLSLPTATVPITPSYDPYKLIQVHDYKGVSFFRQNPNVKAASTAIIKQFGLVYPELLKEKFFVNVPSIMGWLYGMMKFLVAEKTRKKFHPMANGAHLAAEFPAASSGDGGMAFDTKRLPKEYGGTLGNADGTLRDLEGEMNGEEEGVEELKFE